MGANWVSCRMTFGNKAIPELLAHHTSVTE